MIKLVYPGMDENCNNEQFIHSLKKYIDYEISKIKICPPQQISILPSQMSILMENGSSKKISEMSHILGSLTDTIQFPVVLSPTNGWVYLSQIVTYVGENVDLSIAYHEETVTGTTTLANLVPITTGQGMVLVNCYFDDIVLPASGTLDINLVWDDVDGTQSATLISIGSGGALVTIHSFPLKTVPGSAIKWKGFAPAVTGSPSVNVYLQVIKLK